MPGDFGWLGALGSVSLVAVAIAVSLWKRLGVGKTIVWSAVRAAVQLAAVGVLFQLIFGSEYAMAWAWVWVVAMTVVSTEIVARRVRYIPGLRAFTLVALIGAVGVTLALLFGLNVLDLGPVTLVVMGGITLGNTLPAAVQSVDLVTIEIVDHQRRVEALLSLGFDKSGASRMVTSTAVRMAMVPQIERTKVIGLIALPGTLTGMLLAGADPSEAVVVQLVVTYLVLGSAGVATSVVVSAIAARGFTRDLRLANWVREEG